MNIWTRRDRVSGLGWMACVGLAAAGAGLGGCSGHGRHTSEGLSKAQERVAGMKSAQEFDMARQSFLAGDLGKALKNIDQSLMINPTVAKSHVLRGRILLEKGDLPGAIASLTKAEELDPQNVEAWYYRGVIAERLDRREEALERYTKAAELDPSNAQYPVAAGEMLIALERLEEAEAYLAKAGELHTHNPAIRQLQAHVAVQRGRTDEALSLLSEARLLASDDPAVLEDLVRVQIQARRYAQAEVNLSLMLKNPANKDRRDLMQMRARCLILIDRLVEARAVLLELTGGAEGASDTESWIELGEVSVALGDANRLGSAWQRVVALAPDRPEGYTLRALWHRDRGELTRALSAADRAVDVRGKSTGPLILRGLLRERAGQAEGARADFEQARREDPQNSAVERVLATPRAPEVKPRERGGVGGMGGGAGAASRAGPAAGTKPQGRPAGR